MNYDVVIACFTMRVFKLKTHTPKTTKNRPNKKFLFTCWCALNNYGEICGGCKKLSRIFLEHFKVLIRTNKEAQDFGMRFN